MYLSAHPVCCAGIDGVTLETLTISDTLDGLTSGAFTSVELTKAFLARIAKYEDVYNAFTFLNPDVLALAEASDARRASGAPLGSLEGARMPTRSAEMVSW